MAVERESAKLVLAWPLCRTGADRALVAIQRFRLGNAFIRAVNYHGTPAVDADSFRRQLEYYRKRFVPCGQSQLAAFLERGEWDADKPGLIVSFDDGLRTNYEVAAPLLEQYGFVGWFFVPTDFVEAGRWPDGRPAMSWDDLRELCDRHVVGCHTRTHHRLTATTPDAQLDDEINSAKHVLEAGLRRRVDVFCWVGGEERSYSAAAAQRIDRAGYRFSFMSCSHPVTRETDPLHLHRTHIESSWPLDLVRLQLSGVADWASARKRQRVDRLTA